MQQQRDVTVVHNDVATDCKWMGRGNAVRDVSPRGGHRERERERERERGSLRVGSGLVTAGGSGSRCESVARNAINSASHPSLKTNLPTFLHLDVSVNT